MFLTLFNELLAYKYAVLVSLALFEGPYAMMGSGFLIKTGTLALVPTYLALSLGDLIGDGLWYYAGRIFGTRFVRKFGKYVDVTQEDVHKLKLALHERKNVILLTSKLTAGFGLSTAVLLAAGIAEIPFARFMLLNIIGQIFWTAMMLAVGYFFGTWYIAVSSVATRLLIAGVALGFILVVIRSRKYIKGMIKEELES